MTTIPNTRQKQLPKRTGKPHIYIAHLDLPDRPRVPVLCWTEEGPHRISRTDYRNLVLIEQAWFGRRGIGM